MHHLVVEKGGVQKYYIENELSEALLNNKPRCNAFKTHPSGRSQLLEKRNFKSLVQWIFQSFNMSVSIQELRFCDVVSIWAEHQRDGGAEWWNVKITRGPTLWKHFWGQWWYFPRWCPSANSRVFINAAKAFQWMRRRQGLPKRKL